MTAEQPERRGAPPDAVMDADFVIVRGTAVRSLGDYNTAGVFQRIAWRCERHGGSWRVTVADLAAEVWLSEKQVKRALAILREKGWIDATQDHPLDRTLTYTVVMAQSPTGPLDGPETEAAPPNGPTGPLDGPTGILHRPYRAASPIETETTTETTAASPAATRRDDEPIEPRLLASLAEALDDLLLSDFDAAEVYEAIRAHRPDVEHPVAFIRAMARREGEQAARGFLETVGAA